MRNLLDILRQLDLHNMQAWLYGKWIMTIFGACFGMHFYYLCDELCYVGAQSHLAHGRRTLLDLEGCIS